MRTGTPIGKNYVTLCIERIFAEEPRIHVIVKLWHTEKPEDLGGKGYEDRI